MRAKRVARVGLLCAAALLASACGSTVQQQGSARSLGSESGLAGSDGLTSGGGPGGGAAAGTISDGLAGGQAITPGGSPVGGAAVIGGSGTAPTGGNVGGGTTGSTGTAQGQQPPLRTGPGVTDKVIRIGAVYSDNADAANKAAGVEGITNGDLKREYELLRDDINRRGGIAGRKLELVLVNVDSTSSQDAEAQREAVCSTFTRDKPVFAFIGAGSDSFRTCIRKGGAVQVHNTVSSEDDRSLRLTPSFAFAHGVSLTRVARGQVQQLARGGFFDKGAKHGLVTFDDPSFVRAAKEELEPAMIRNGTKFAETVFVPPAQKLEDNSALSAAISSAVLRFRQNGITHVQFMQSTGDISLFFMRNAESQGYRPRYGLNGQDAGQGLVGSDPPLVPPAQFANAVGYGWYPLFDVPRTEAKTSYTSRTKQCLKIFGDGGITFPDYNSEIVALFQCDAFLFLETALKAQGSALNQASFEQVIGRVGTGYVPASTFATSFAPGRTDGVSRVRTFKFFVNCNCFHYTGPPSQL